MAMTLRTKSKAALAAIVAVGVTIFAKFILGDWFANLFPMPEFWKLTGWQWFLVIIFPLILIALGTVIALFGFVQRWEDERIEAMLGQWKTSTDAQISKLTIASDEVGNRWKRCASDLEIQLRKARFDELWLSHPWEYVDYIEKVDTAYAAMHSGHVGEITIYGTMVGFSFLLPMPLSKHVERSDGQFTRLRLLGSNTEARLSSAHGNEELSRFPLYLLAQLAEHLVAPESTFADHLKAGKTFTVQVCYLEHDMLSAAILYRGVEAATLQALDSAIFQRIIEGKQPQPGFRYPNSDQADAYDRVEAVLDNVANRFAGDGEPSADGRKCEVWRFYGNAHEIALKISNPHWRLDDNNNPTRAEMIKAKDYYSATNSELDLPGIDVIRMVVGMLLVHLRSLSPIDRLHPIVKEFSDNDWAKSRTARETYRQTGGAPPAA